MLISRSTHDIKFNRDFNLISSVILGYITKSFHDIMKKISKDKSLSMEDKKYKNNEHLIIFPIAFCFTINKYLH